MTDHLFATKSYCSFYSLKIFFSDFLSPHHNTFNKAWLSSWISLPPNYAIWRTEIFPSISSHPWFHRLDLPRSTIVKFSHLRLSHNLLPFHSFSFSFNSTPFCTLHTSESSCGIVTYSSTVCLSHMNVLFFFPNSPFLTTPLPTINLSLNLVFLHCFSHC